MDNKKFIQYAINELEKINFIDKKEVIDSTILHMPKAYPAYFGTYNKFNEIIEYTDKIHNLFLVGRNGMHRYNNQDHSMLSAMEAVRNIVNNNYDKTKIWQVNAEKVFHEKK